MHRVRLVREGLNRQRNFSRLVLSSLPHLCRRLGPYFDGHASHFNPIVVEKAIEEDVIIFCFPPNCMHLLRPLDKNCFPALKTESQKSCQSYMAMNPGEVVCRSNFYVVFAEAWQNSVNTKNIFASFKTTGVYPFNRSAIILPV